MQFIGIAGIALCVLVVRYCYLDAKDNWREFSEWRAKQRATRTTS